MIVAEAGPEALAGERRGAVRTELRRAARRLSESSEPDGYDSPADDLRVRAALEAVPEAIVILDRDDTVRYANVRLRDAYGLDPGQAVGRSLADLLTMPELLLRLADPEAFLDATLRLLATRDAPCEDLFRHSDGSTFLRRSVPAGEGAYLGRLLITTNVTRMRTRNRRFDRDAEAPAPAPADMSLGSRPRLTVLQGGRSS